MQGPGFDAKREDTVAAGSPPPPSRKRTLGDMITGSVAAGYARVGALAGTRPWWVIGGCVVLMLVMASGFAGFKNETRPDKLWVPASSQAQDDKAFVEDNFTKGSRVVVAQLVARDGASDVLVPETMARLEEVRAATAAVTATATVAGAAGVAVAYDTACSENACLCLRFGDTCFQQSLLDVFPSAAAYDTRDEIVARVNQSPLEGSSGLPLEIGSVAGGLTRDAAGRITAAEAVRFVALLKYDPELRGGEEVDPKADAFEEVWIGEMEKLAASLDDSGDPLRLTYFASRSFGDEFGAEISSDVTLIQAAVVITFFYAFVMLSDWTRGCLKTRGYLTLSTLLTIGLAVASAFGLAQHLGFFYSPLMSVFPILLLGIGVDDSFVITNAFDNVSHADPGASIASRLSRGLASAGSSITVTSLTDFGAFLIGTNTSLPALRNFSIYAAIGILFTLFYSATFYSSSVAIDARRRDAKRLDVLCCVTSKTDEEEQKAAVCCRVLPPGKDARWVHKIMRGLGKALATKAGKVASLLTFGSFLVIGIVGTTQITIRSSVTDFVPQNSYLKDYFDDSTANFQVTGEEVAVYAGEADYSSAKMRSFMDVAAVDFEADQYIVGSTVSSWWVSFRDVPQSDACKAPGNVTFCTEVSAAAAGTVDRALFDATVKRFIEDGAYAALGGAKHSEDVVFDAATGEIKATIVARGQMVYADNSVDQIATMDSTRATVAAAKAKAGVEDLVAFAYSPDFLNYEQYKAVRAEFVTNISLALAMVIAIVFLMLGSVKGSLVTATVIVMIVVEIIGFLHFWGVSIDAVCVINLVIALGLSVDYSVHIAHGFMEQHGSPNERLVKALEEVGTAVVNGGLSTWFAVLMLGGSSSYVFVLFFKALFLCTTLGIANGLLFLPVALSLVNPPPLEHTASTGEAAAKDTALEGKEPTTTYA